VAKDEKEKTEALVARSTLALANLTHVVDKAAEGQRSRSRFSVGGNKPTPPLYGLLLTTRLNCPLYFDGELAPRLGLSALGAASLSEAIYPPETPCCRNVYHVSHEMVCH
jgi:hypothetical protein